METGYPLLNCEKFDPSAPYPGVWNVTNTWSDPPRINHVAWKTYSGINVHGIGSSRSGLQGRTIKFVHSAFNYSSDAFKKQQKVYLV